MNPVKPGTDKAPTGQRLNISLSFANNKQRWQRAAFRINKIIKSIPSIKVAAEKTPKAKSSQKRDATLKANAAYVDSGLIMGMNKSELIKETDIMTNSARYEYQVDASLETYINSQFKSILEEEILSGSEFWTNRFFMTHYINEAMNDGVADSFESAVRISTGTDAAAMLELTSVTAQLASPAFQDRINMMNGRVFEMMSGLTADTRAQLRFTLSESMARGLGIRDITGLINNRLGVSMGRAERIARTEINNAYTNSYMQESEDLNKTTMGGSAWEIKQCHRSALSPTTRPTHAARHGTVSTMTEQLEWWAENGRINCLCSTLDVLVNKKTGKVLQSKMVGRMTAQRPR